VGDEGAQPGGGSPVPSDADLSPGELPFTTWGQHEFGDRDLRVFDQTVWWVDLRQQPHRIDEMCDAYIRNVIGFLEDNCQYFYEMSLRRLALQILGDQLLGRANGDLLAAQLGATPLSAVRPGDWLAGTPLMRRLRARAL
jgi:hypothetical protein